MNFDGHNYGDWFSVRAYGRSKSPDSDGFDGFLVQTHSGAA
jgi:hypothetical protein